MSPLDAGRDALAALAEHGVAAWLFTLDEWFVTDPDACYVPLETRTVSRPPRVVPSLEPWLGACGKIVGSTPDRALLARAETEIRTRLDGRATARRSQPYYLDVTRRDADKGSALLSLCGRLGVDPAETACIGDAENELPMFAAAAFAIAMGNAEPGVKEKAAAVSGRNDADGWADAVDRMVIPQARSKP